MVVILTTLSDRSCLPDVFAVSSFYSALLQDISVCSPSSIFRICFLLSFLALVLRSATSLLFSSSILLIQLSCFLVRFGCSRNEYIHILWPSSSLRTYLSLQYLSRNSYCCRLLCLVFIFCLVLRRLSKPFSSLELHRDTCVNFRHAAALSHNAGLVQLQILAGTSVVRGDSALSPRTVCANS